MSELQKQIIQALQNASDGYDYFDINEETGLLNIDAQLDLETLEKEFIKVLYVTLLSDKFLRDFATRYKEYTEKIITLDEVRELMLEAIAKLGGE
jgi:hypothetical protein